MGYTEPHLWVDDPEAERDERIGDHEGYGTLYDIANDRYLGNHVPWVESLGAFLNNREEGPEWLRDLLDDRFRVVPRCKCDPVWCGGAEWAGSKQGIVRDSLGGVDFTATEQDVLAAWRFHVESHRAALADRQAAAARRRAGYLVAFDEFAALDSTDRFVAIRTARAALDAIEVDAVVEERRKGRNWGEIGVMLGTSKQGARQRFLRHDPQGAEAA